MFYELWASDACPSSTCPLAALSSSPSKIQSSQAVNLQRCNCQRVIPLSLPPPVTSSVTSEASHLTSTCSGFICPSGQQGSLLYTSRGAGTERRFINTRQLGLPVWKETSLLCLGPVFTFRFPKSQRKMLCSARKCLLTCGS